MDADDLPERLGPRAVDGVPGDDGRRDRLIGLLDRRGVAAAARTGVGSERHDPDGDTHELVARLGAICTVAVDELGITGAGVTVMAGVRGGLAGARGQLYATDEISRRLEDLQLTVGEGPCLDAFRDGMPVLVPDLAAGPGRWLGFGPEAVAAGAAAVFSLPLQVGAVRLGTLDLHRDEPGGLAGERLADALTLAGLATEALLELAHDPAGPDTGGGEDDMPGRSSRLPGAGWLPDTHATVHQASGMVAARERIDVGEALLRIRAAAFARGTAITEVAQQIVDRELTLPDPHHPSDGRPDDGPTDTDAER